jgi:hypothetical protein
MRILNILHDSFLPDGPFSEYSEPTVRFRLILATRAVSQAVCSFFNRLISCFLSIESKSDSQNPEIGFYHKWNDKKKKFETEKTSILTPLDRYFMPPPPPSPGLPEIDLIQL